MTTKAKTRKKRHPLQHFDASEKPLPKGRVQFHDLFVAKRIKDTKTGKEKGEPLFSVTVLYPKKTTDMSRLDKAVKAALVSEFGKDRSEWPEGWKSPIKDGDSKKYKDKPNCHGHYIVTYSTRADIHEPQVLSRSGKVIDQKSREFYPGCWVIVSGTSQFYQVNDDVCGVKLYLEHVQKVDDGERFGGAKDAKSSFKFDASTDEEEDDADDFDGDLDDSEE